MKPKQKKLTHKSKYTIKQWEKILNKKGINYKPKKHKSKKKLKMKGGSGFGSGFVSFPPYESTKEAKAVAKAEKDKAKAEAKAEKVKAKAEAKAEAKAKKALAKKAKKASTEPTAGAPTEPTAGASTESTDPTAGASTVEEERVAEAKVAALQAAETKIAALQAKVAALQAKVALVQEKVATAQAGGNAQAIDQAKQELDAAYAETWPVLAALEEERAKEGGEDEELERESSLGSIVPPGDLLIGRESFGTEITEAWAASA